MKQFIIILTSLLFIFGCGDNSNQQPKEKADQLSQQAEEEMSRQNYEEAERLLIESINLHSEENNETKLAENYSSLSTVQVLSGKLSPALESFIALRGLYGRTADRNAELRAMLQIGHIYFQLGKKRESLAILNEVYNNSQLYRLEQIRAMAAVDIAGEYAAMNLPEASIPYLKSAALYYESQKDIPHALQTECSLINSLTLIDKIDEAIAVYNKNVSLITSSTVEIIAPLFFLRCGEAFTKAGEFSFAKMNFEQGLELIEQQSNYQNSLYAKHLQIGLGELFFRNFDFVKAQNHFTKAYEFAKNEQGTNDGIVFGYLLVRIADCISKRTAYHSENSNDGIIHATQLYEQSLTYFARAGLGIGEAIALHRLGILKQLSKDDNAAITFYKRAFEKFTRNTLPLVFYSLPVDIAQLCSSISQPNSIESWFSDNLIFLLLNYKKFAEALSYYETVRNMKLQSDLRELQLQFRENAKDKRYSELQRTITEKNVKQLELYHLNMLQKQNKNYAGKLQQQLVYLQSKIASDIISLSQEYPVFSFMSGVQKSSFAAISEAVPPASIILEYCFAGNEMWVFIVRNNSDVLAVKLSSFGYSLKKKMDRFVESLSRSSIRSTAMVSMKSELFSFLIQPIESLGKQSFIIIPPIGLEKFPFHVLSKNERPLLEFIDVTYLPSIPFVLQKTKALSVQNRQNVVAFGFSTDSRWGLEFELRDIRSFFKNTQANVNLAATPEKLYSTTGDMLQLSTIFQKNSNGIYSFLLSSGSTLKSGTSVSIEKFTSYHSFPIVYLSDVQSTANNISTLHPLLWMLNGSASIITTQFPITSNISKSFSENFYTSLLSEESPLESYRRSVILLERKKDIFGGASYFHYGIQ